MRYHNNIPVFGQHDEGTLEQISDVASRAVRTALYELLYIWEYDIQRGDFSGIQRILENEKL